MYTLSNERLSRFNFKNPCTRYKEDTGYQVCNGLIAISSGGLFGNNNNNNQNQAVNQNQNPAVDHNQNNLIEDNDNENQNLISIWADIIVWFPWESDSDFLETFKWIKDYWITKLHVFPFSDHTQRDSIPASLFPNQINQMVKKEREKNLIIQGDKVRNDFLIKNKWTSHKVLLEEKRNWKRRWWTENYIQVEVEWDFQRWDIIDYTI